MTRKINYGDTVIVTNGASQHYRPGVIAEVCGIRTMTTEIEARAVHEDAGTVMYLIELSDGSSLEVPEKYFQISQEQAWLNNH